MHIHPSSIQPARGWKLLGCSLLLLLLPWQTIAAQNEAQAKEVFQQMVSKYKAMACIAITFSYELYQPAVDLRDKLQGEALLQDNMYRLDLGDQLIISDGQTIWTYLKETNEVTITRPETADLGLNIWRFLTNQMPNYRYRLQQAPQKQQLLELTPFDKNKEPFKIELLLDKQRQNLLLTRLFYKDGSQHSYEIHDLKSMEKQDMGSFRFDKSAYQDVEVIDLR